MSSAHEYLHNAKLELHREKQQAKSDFNHSLSAARGILFVVGLLHVLLFSLLFAFAGREVDQVLVKDPNLSRESLLLIVRIGYGILIGISCCFFGFGMIIHHFPVIATAGGLVLYLIIGTLWILGGISLLKLGVGISILVSLVKALIDAINYSD